MTKENNGIKFRLIHLMLILLGIFGSGVAGWVWQQAETKAIGKETTTMKKEGCEPAQAATSSIELIEYRLSTIDKKQEEFSTEQKAMSKKSDEFFHEVLKRLPEK